MEAGTQAQQVLGLHSKTCHTCWYRALELVVQRTYRYIYMIFFLYLDIKLITNEQLQTKRLDWNSYYGSYRGKTRVNILNWAFELVSQRASIGFYWRKDVH